MKTLRRRAFLAWRRYRGRETEMFAPHGVPVRVPADADLAIRYLLARGRPYEAEEAELVRAFLAPGTDVIELGGCLGILSALIRERIGPEAHHVVVEANPHLAAICRENAARGAAPGRCEVVVAAIDYSGALTVRYATGGNAHEGHVGAPGDDGIEVPATRLSELAARLPADRFALVCDIEGAEAAMIAAETALLARIDLVILETHPKRYAGGRSTLDDLRRRLHDAGLETAREIDGVIAFVRAGRPETQPMTDPAPA